MSHPALSGDGESALAPNEAVVAETARRVSEARANESGRGREARRPHHMPWRGWKDILWRVKEEIVRDRVGTIAAGTTFYILLALFPAIGAFVGLYGLLSDPASIQQNLDDLQRYVPSSALDIIGEELKRLTQKPAALSTGFIISLLLTLWSTNSGVKALFEALNIAYDEPEKRGFFSLNLQALAFTLGALVFFIVLLNMILVLPWIMDYLPLGPLGGMLLSLLPPLVLFGVATAGIACLYRYGPSRRHVQWRWIMPGALASALVWLAGSAGFSFYLARFNDYSGTYGSLGAVVGLMMWIYISLWIVLVGAELNAELEHQTAIDTTIGPDKPLGQRGAMMADRVGEGR